MTKLILSEKYTSPPRHAAQAERKFMMNLRLLILAELKQLERDVAIARDDVASIKVELRRAEQLLEQKEDRMDELTETLRKGDELAEFS